jgi:hypothetical protein
MALCSVMTLRDIANSCCAGVIVVVLYRSSTTDDQVYTIVKSFKFQIITYRKLDILEKIFVSDFRQLMVNFRFAHAKLNH